jgi:hypothetical protein
VRRYLYIAIVLFLAILYAGLELRQDPHGPVANVQALFICIAGMVMFLSLFIYIGKRLGWDHPPQPNSRRRD